MLTPTSLAANERRIWSQPTHHHFLGSFRNKPFSTNREHTHKHKHKRVKAFWTPEALSPTTATKWVRLIDPSTSNVDVDPFNFEMIACFILFTSSFISFDMSKKSCVFEFWKISQKRLLVKFHMNTWAQLLPEHGVINQRIWESLAGKRLAVSRRCRQGQLSCFTTCFQIRIP